MNRLVCSVALPEFVILRKPEYFRHGGSEKHVRDITRILRIQEGRIAGEFLESAVQQRGLKSQLDQIIAGL